LRGEYFALDEVGAVVWEAFARGEALGTVATSLAALYEADREQIDADVCALVDELTQRHLLVPVD